MFLALVRLELMLNWPHLHRKTKWKPQNYVARWVKVCKNIGIITHSMSFKHDFNDFLFLSGNLIGFKTI